MFYSAGTEAGNSVKNVNFMWICVKKKWFKLFQNSNIFSLSDREFDADQKCSGCLFCFSDKIKLHFLFNK